jgi:plastocyanin
MTNRYRIATLAAALLILLVAGVTACGKKTTNPIVAKELNSGNIGAGGAQFPHTFANAGSFSYHCAIHASMRGTVTVGLGNPLAVAITIVDFSFSPSPVLVAPGGTVTWTNNGPSTHTVTSD